MAERSTSPTVPLDEAVGQILEWPVDNAAAAVLLGGRPSITIGSSDRPFPLASISKVFTSYATMIAVEEGTIGLDDPVGQPGCTVRHLLAHAGGFPFDGDAPIAKPGARRIYSNRGYELVARHVAERAGLPFAVYLTEAVLEPLGCARTRPLGSPAKGFVSCLDDLTRFVAELVHPTLLDPATWAAACTPQFPELAGVVPGVGSFAPCPWGLGPEIRGAKQPHWTGTANSAATSGHFGGAGTFFWVDPDASVALIVLTDRQFDEWALRAWPALSDTVLQSANRSRGG